MGSGNSSEGNHEKVTASTDEQKTDDNGGCCSDNQAASKTFPDEPHSTHLNTPYSATSINILDHLNNSNRISVLEHLRSQVIQELQAHAMDNSSAPQYYGPNPLHSSLGFPDTGVASPSATRLALPTAETIPEVEQPVLYSKNQNPVVTMLQRQVQLYDELIHLSRQCENLGTANAPAPTGTNTSICVPHQTDTNGGNNISIIHPIEGSTQSNNVHSMNIVDTSAPFAGYQPFSSETNGKDVMVQNLDGIHPVSDLSFFPDVREAAYQSHIVEVDSNALARLLKKHFNNFVLECEFNATGNDQAYEIIRSRRCDHLRVDDSYSAGHNLTIPKTKDVADLFLKYCMSVIDAQCWGGELRYAITKPKTPDTHIGSLVVRGVVNYLTADRLMKMDGPYQVEVDFILVEEA